MDKVEYKDLLESKEWKIKRDSILKRDNYKCVRCKQNKKLHIHHTYYLIDKLPWQVPDDCLVTLCEKCHKKEHENNKIGTFFRKRPPKRKKKFKKLSKMENLRNSVPKKDEKIQQQYDEYNKKRIEFEKRLEKNEI